MKEEASSEDIILDNKLRQTLFYLFCIEYCISSCDGGIVPQQNINMQKDFHSEDDESVRRYVGQLSEEASLGIASDIRYGRGK